MPSTPPLDPVYLAARRVLLDALFALSQHNNSLIVVGAQAIYLHTDDADLDAVVAPFTSDADLALDPTSLAEEPQLVAAMRAAGFSLKVRSGDGGIEPGSWVRSVEVEGEQRVIPVDLIVPGALAPRHRRRDARLAGHGERATRWADGLEAAMVDNARLTVSSLEPAADTRCATVKVAGIAALLIAKCHKIHDRLNEGVPGRNRARSKDAADVVRLMRGSLGPKAIGTNLAILSLHPTAGQSVRVGVDHLRDLFANPASRGVDMAADALAGALAIKEIQELAPAFVAGVLESFTSGRVGAAAL